MIVPMLIIINHLSGGQPALHELIRQLLGGILIIGIIFYILRKKTIVFPFQRYIQNDHELQVFIAFSLCFGFSLLTAWLGLSAALGAFLAGIMVSSSRSTQWVFNSLHSFKILFVALFFVSVGMLIDLNFIREYLVMMITLLVLVFVVNNAINVVMLRFFCKDWRISLYAGALLSQVGEFSFIIVSVGYYAGFVGEFIYQVTISIIALSLLVSPFYTGLIRRVIEIDRK